LFPLCQATHKIRTSEQNKQEVLPACCTTASETDTTKASFQKLNEKEALFLPP